MEKFDYYKVITASEAGEKALDIIYPILEDGEPEKDSVNTVRYKLKQELGEVFIRLEVGKSLRDYWEETEKILYVERKGNNYLTTRGAGIHIIREEVKEELYKVFGEEIENYLEFLDVNLKDPETNEDITNIGKWYIINILNFWEGLGESEFMCEGEMYWILLYKNKVLDDKGNSKYPIFRMKEWKTAPIISKEFKEVLDKFDIEGAEVWGYRGLYYREDLPCTENEKDYEEELDLSRWDDL